MRKDPARVAGARLPRVPRRLRHRDEPPRDQDPLHDPERRPAHRLPSARSRRGSTWRRELRARGLPLRRRSRARAPLRGLRRRRLLAAVRAHVHQRAHDARPRRHPAARAPTAARTIRSSSPAARPRPTPSRWRRSSTPFFIGDGEERSTELALRLDARCKRDGRAAARAPASRWREAARRLRARRSTTTAVDADTGLESSSARPSIRGVPARRQARLVDGPQPLPVPRRRRRSPDAEAIFDRMSIEIARGCTEGCRFCQAGMIYRPGARARSRADRRDASCARVQEGRLRRGRADVALDRRLLVHRAARQDGRWRGSRRRRSSLVASRRCAPTASNEELLDEIATRARQRPHVRARGRHASACATSSTRTSPRSSSSSTAERVFSRGWRRHEALLHDRPAHRDGRGRARHRRDRRRALQAIGARATSAARRGHASASRRTCPSRTRRSSGARWTRCDGDRAQAGAAARRGARAQRVDAARCTSTSSSLSRASSRAATGALADVLERACRARRALRLLGRAASSSTRWRRGARRAAGIDAGALPRHASR